MPTRPSREAELPSPFQGGELLGIEALEERARRLAAALTVDDRASASRAHLRRLKAHMAALRDVYHIEGLAALQERWLDYARKQAAVDIASSRDLDTAPDGTRRD